MLKRSFIPPEFRPEVRGSKLVDLQDSFIKEISSPQKRKKLILEIMKGNEIIEGLDLKRSQEQLKLIFPNLKSK